MTPPTRLDLERLLWSDPASAAWEADAREVLSDVSERRRFVLTSPTSERVAELLGVVASEIDPFEDDGDDEVTTLEGLACSAKRAAILALHAAWAAESAASRGRGGGEPDDDTTGLLPFARPGG